MLKVGDVVKLKVDNDNPLLMTIEEIRTNCDGTGHDGAGLRCRWFEDTEIYEAWVSESSVEFVK